MLAIKIFVIILLSERFSTITCSLGDRSPFYQKCMNICVRENCIEHGKSFSDKGDLHQDIWGYLLQWSCYDECCYECMWHTVARFEKAGQETPKFHGKWPFLRFLGVQEPAAAFSSLLNLAANLYMYMKIKREFPMRSSPMALLWHIFAFVCMNAWTWSTIFHTRDNPFTEFMDYACALSMVVGLFVTGLVRVFHNNRKMIALLLGPILFYFATHVQYLYDGRIDYDYNMRVNVFVGVLGSAVWVAWASAQVAAGRRHARRVALFALASGAALALELLDFPPLGQVWDAHALWHLATAPLPLLFYRFVIEDLRFLQPAQYEKIGVKLT